ncbi:SarA family transcriptional regulator [Staphylococcus aureus]|uniref:SarA family transcriptional regulator n=1 Tax=Staphylococcus aureus TaxID=1280 RepID=UPI00215B8595|nr:SarA family transcriptional regulator [Staphylococcus aureus]UVI82164.1 SarA family transcriptional regulator [Staphylococcus aureus]
MNCQTFEKVNKLIDVEAYIFFLAQELKQQNKLSLKELLILAYFYYKKKNDISLKEIIGDILYKQSDIVKNIKSLSKKGFINKSRTKNDERCIFVSVTPLQRKKISYLISDLDKIIIKFNIDRNYTEYQWAPKYSKDFFILFMNIMYSKDFLKYRFNLTFLDLSILYILSSRKNEVLYLKDLFENIRFMYPQIARSVNRLNDKGMLIKERSLADERIVLVKFNKAKDNTIKSIFTDTSKILKPRKFFF